MAKCITVSNGKGGVGKTTTVTEILSHLSDLIGPEDKLLAIDLDPSGNLTRRLTGLKFLSKNQLTITNYLLDPKNTPPEELILGATAGWPKTYLIPSDKELTDICLRIAARGGWELRLKKLVDQLKNFFSVILIDTGPTLCMLHTMAFRASDIVLVPADCGSDDALNGVHDVKLSIEILKEEDSIACAKEVLVFIAAAHKETSRPFKIAVAEFKKQLGDSFLSELTVPHRASVGTAVWGNIPAIPTKLIEDPKDKLILNYRKLSSMLMEC